MVARADAAPEVGTCVGLPSSGLAHRSAVVGHVAVMVRLVPTASELKAQGGEGITVTQPGVPETATMLEKVQRRVDVGARELFAGKS